MHVFSKYDWISMNIEPIFKIQKPKWRPMSGISNKHNNVTDQSICSPIIDNLGRQSNPKVCPFFMFYLGLSFPAEIFSWNLANRWATQYCIKYQKSKFVAENHCSFKKSTAMPIHQWGCLHSNPKWMETFLWFI